MGFSAEDGPARDDEWAESTFDRESVCSYNGPQFLPILSGDLWLCFDGEDKDLKVVTDVDLEEVGEKVDLLAAVEVVALVAERKRTGRGAVH